MSGNKTPKSKIHYQIDRSSPQPVYLQLAGLLHQQILTGLYQPGTKLPSEAMLVEQFSVSPMTVRRAVNYLAAQGVISTHKGKGTFVKSVELEDAAFYLRDISDIFGNQETTRVKLLEVRFVPANQKIARKLNIPVGEKVIYLRRLLFIENTPAFYHREYLINIPTQPIVEAEMEVTDLKGVFYGSGSAMIKNGEITMEGMLLNSKEAELLDIGSSKAGMMLEHTFYDFNDKPLSWGWFVCESERLKLKTWVGLTMNNGGRDERKR